LKEDHVSEVKLRFQPKRRFRGVGNEELKRIFGPRGEEITGIR
jgi:hypothetical protein